MKLLMPLILVSVLGALPANADPGRNATGAIVHVNAVEAAQLLANKDEKKRPVIIDIRTLEEFRETHLKGARQIDFLENDFAARIGKLDRTRAYLIHCHSGGRSSRSLALWNELGFKKIYHLDGGILAWEKASQPVVK